MKTRLVTIAFALSSISTLAIAQTPATPAAPSTTTAAPMTNSSAGTSSTGFRMADTATLAVKYVTVQPASFMSSKLVGTSVYNNQNETVGEIEDLVIDNGNAITGVVVSVGGFLGLGESYVVLDPSTVVLNQKDGTWKAFVDTSKDNLKSAPKFTYTKKKS